ncbi:amino acid adenylation domain-containing protein [Melittangium boletus]|uniref:amino acid adenylation domain-containing protein n=1 Tax=Melittangium boletus TaxID=83453 RepID=UPI003DA5F341
MKDSSTSHEEISSLSPAQRRVWLLTEFESAHSGHHVAAAWRLDGALEAGPLEASLREVVRRHALVRSRLLEEDGEPRLQALSEESVRLVHEDLRQVPAAEREARLEARLGEEARRPFSLFEGPLLRATLFQLDARTHVLLFVAHRLVADAASLGVLARELSVLRTQAASSAGSLSMGDAFLSGRISYGDMLASQKGLPPLALSAAAHLEARRVWFGGPEAARRLAGWKERLAGSTPLELPLDRPRPPVRSQRGASHDFTLSAPLAERARGLARQRGVTLEAVLLAAFAAVLSRASGQTEATVGVGREGRERPELKALVAPLADELPLRLSLSGEEGFAALVGRVSEALAALRVPEELPFGLLLEELRPPPDLSRTPVFQVLFSLEEAPAGLDLPGVKSSPVEVESGATPADLGLRVLGGGGGALRARLTYDTALFEASTAERLASQLGTLLEAALAAPERPVSTLPLMAEEARRRLFASWNDTRDDFPRDSTYSALFEAQVARTPDAVALEYEGEVLTYRELNARANRLAWHLRSLGVGPEVLVGVAVERSPALVVAPLAVFKAGGAYIPLDPAYPRERLAHMLAAGRPPVVLTTRASQGALPDTGARRVLLDTLDLVSGEQDTNPPETATAEHLAYVLFTSGSTGQPAGVQVPHRSLVNVLTTSRAWPRPRAGESLLAVTTLSFDLACMELFQPLLGGARLLLAPRDVVTDGARLRELLETRSPTMFMATPATWRMVLEAGWSRGTGLRAVSAGEALPPELARRLLATGLELWNGYGPTETTIYATVARIDGAGPISIGRPLSNTTLHVLDAHLRPVPVGARGVLYIGGEGVSRGYRARPELTARRFLPDPFSSVPGARMYRSGDEVRYLPDGSLEYLGREDFQVKVRGFRIELGDVEAALARHPQVKQAVVVAREDAPGTRRLVAYVVPQPSGTPSWTELRAFLGGILPEFMVPSACVVLEAMPLSPVGKVDRSRLPAPESALPALDGARVPPRTPEEHALVGLWREVLGLESVGIRDGFFELGGDSLLATRVVARAARAGLRLTARQFALHPTIEELAAVATSTQEAPRSEESSGEDLVIPPIVQWWLERDAGFLDHDNCALMFEVPVDVDPALLEQAFRALIAHHDSLRLRLQRRADGRWRMFYGPAVQDAFWSIVDLSAVPAEQLPGALFGETCRLNASLDLARGPLMRVTLLRLPGPSCRLHLVVHHLLVDEVSLRLLVDDLQLAYTQLQRGEPVRLAPPATTLQRWGERLREYARAPEVLRDLPYWRRRVQAPFHPLPVDFPSGTSFNASARFTPTGLSPDETRALLEGLPRKLGVTADDLLLTALVLALEGLTHRRDLHLNVAGHGRDVEVPGVDVSRAVGWIGSLTPLYLDAGGTSDTPSALRAIQAQLRAVPAKGLSWSLLRYLSDDAALRQELAAAPQPEVVYSFIGSVDPTFDPTALLRPAREFAGMEHAPQALRTDRLALIGMVMGGQLQLMALTCDTLFRQETIQALMDRLRGHLLELAALATDG